MLKIKKNGFDMGLPSINNATISFFGRIKPSQKQYASEIDRGIATHGKMGKFFADHFGAGTIKINVNGSNFYINRASCFKFLHGKNKAKLEYQAFKNETRGNVIAAIQTKFDRVINSNPSRFNLNESVEKKTFLPELSLENPSENESVEEIFGELETTSSSEKPPKTLLICEDEEESLREPFPRSYLQDPDFNFEEALNRTNAVLARTDDWLQTSETIQLENANASAKSANSIAKLKRMYQLFPD